MPEQIWDALQGRKPEVSEFSAVAVDPIHCREGGSPGEVGACCVCLRLCRQVTGKADVELRPDRAKGIKFVFIERIHLGQYKSWLGLHPG